MKWRELLLAVVIIKRADVGIEIGTTANKQTNYLPLNKMSIIIHSCNHFVRFLVYFRWMSSCSQRTSIDAMRCDAKQWEIETKVIFESLQFYKMSHRSSHLFNANLNPPILRIENISMNLWFTIYLWLEKCRACFTFQTKWLIRKFARSLMQCDIYFYREFTTLNHSLVCQY